MPVYVCSVLQIHHDFSPRIELRRSHGRDEELDLQGATTLEACEACVQEYCEVRSWPEYFQDEINVTKYNVQKHGLLGTLKNEVVEVGQDVRDLGHTAKEAIQKGAPQVPGLVRAATDTMGNVVQSGTAAAASTAGGFAARSQEHITNAVHDQVVAPVKRAWHFLVFGFLLCFLVPLFALRSYAPLNTVVSNLGILYLGVCTCCPPSGMRGRAAKAALILLYPLVTVVLPLGLHYWATHPHLADDMGTAIRQLPSTMTRTVQSLTEEVKEVSQVGRGVPKEAPAPAPAPPPPPPPPPPAPPAPAPAPAPAAPAPAPAEEETKDEGAEDLRKPGFLKRLASLFQFFKPKHAKSEAFIPAPISHTGRWATTSNLRPRRFRRSTILEM